MERKTLSLSGKRPDPKETPAPIKNSPTVQMSFVDAVSKFSHAARTSMIDGWTVILTSHGLERDDQRTHLSSSDWRTMVKKIIDKVKTFHTSAEYLFYSVSMDQAVVMNLDLEKKELRMITILPVGRSNPKPGTKKILIESYIFKEMSNNYETIDLDIIDSSDANPSNQNYIL